MTITIIAVPEFSEKKAYSEILNNLSHSPVRYLVCSSGYNKKSSEWFPDLDWAPVDILIQVVSMKVFYVNIWKLLQPSINGMAKI